MEFLDETTLTLVPLISEILKKEVVEPIPIPEGQVRSLEKLVEVLLLSLYDHEDSLTSPFVYEVCRLAREGWVWKKFSQIPFSLPPLTDILKRKRIRDREKKRRKRELLAVISHILSPPKFSCVLRFKVERTKEGVFSTTTTLQLTSDLLFCLLERYASHLLGFLLRDGSVVEWDIPEKLLFPKGEPFTDGFILFFTLPPFALVFVRIPEGFDEKRELSLMGDERKERLVRFNLGEEKFWCLMVDWENENLDLQSTYERFKELLRYFKRRLKRKMSDEG